MVGGFLNGAKLQTLSVALLEMAEKVYPIILPTNKVGSLTVRGLCSHTLPLTLSAILIANRKFLI
jgi:hypothetical protein